MNPKALLGFIFGVLAVASAPAQESTPPFSAAEMETIYSSTITKRTTAVVESLGITDTTKSNKVHGTILSQYRALRSRDEAIDTMLRELSKNAPGAHTNRATLLPLVSKTLHEQFITKLSADLTPEQVEKVKDKMTYDKVQVTHDAYAEIVPNLTGEEKTMILKKLKEAREEAMDGGNADEKSAIFQKYKDQINAYLDSRGHDVNKATKEWEAKQKVKQEAAAKKD